MVMSIAEPIDEAPARLDLAKASLFLDLDGTLAPIAPRPDAVGPDPRRTGLLRRLLKASGGRVAIVSGRRLCDLDRIFEAEVPAIAAVHGLIRRDAQGRTHAPPRPSACESALENITAFAARHPGLMVEDKGLSVALHYRAAPELEDAARAEAERLATRTGLVLQPGKMVVELRAAGPDKGDSLRAFMGEAPFAGARPVFLGDDLTDEAGFAAAGELGGFGVLVGPARMTAATHRLAGPEAALRWLEASCPA
jgi:trehalose 6-phosphate phosphatase